MPRYKLTIEYDGTPYAGWQRQNDVASVQGTIEKAVLAFSQEEVSLTCAGRTDAGVHARGQVAHMDLAKPRECFSIMQGVHHHLDAAPISLVSVEEVDEAFHARFSAQKRYYMYRIVNRPARLALDGLRAWHIYHDMDVSAMQEAAHILVGNHDFSTFRAAACQSKSPIKTLDVLRIEKEGDEIRIYAEALSFLHHQVRNLTGALAHVGTGKWSLPDVQAALDAKDRTKGPVTAPAHGLYFMKVDYPAK